MRSATHGHMFNKRTTAFIGVVSGQTGAERAQSVYSTFKRAVATGQAKESDGFFILPLKDNHYNSMVDDLNEV